MLNAGSGTRPSLLFGQKEGPCQKDHAPATAPTYSAASGVITVMIGAPSAIDCNPEESYVIPDFGA